MPFNIQDFIARLGPGSISNKSHYEVLITGPQELNSMNLEQELVFRCESVTEPGRNILTTSDMYHYGVPQARVYGSSFSEINMSFILSEDYKEKEYFQKWQDIMVGDYRNGNTGPNMFDISYFNEYVGVVKIFRYNSVGELTYSITLKNAYPVLVGDIELSWNDNELAKLPVRFYYQYYVDNIES